MLLLGFGNKARNGKDTAAEAITRFFDNTNKHGVRMVRVGAFKYATELYREVEDLIEQHGLSQVFSGRFELPIPFGNTTYPAVNSWESGPLPNFKTIRIPEWVTPGDITPVPMAKFGKHPKLLQWWGTEFRRTYFGQDYWIKKCFAGIPTNLDVAMITDVRFTDEADAVKRRGGYTINVQRLREDGTQYFSDDRPVDHPSETQLDGYNWDFYLKIPHGHAALTGELAITLAEYLRGLK